MRRVFFCPNTGAALGDPWACAFLGGGMARTGTLMWGHLLPPPCLSQTLVISREASNLKKLNPLKLCTVPRFLIESHSVIVKQSWWNTWWLFSRSLPSLKETIFVIDKHPENIQTIKMYQSHVWSLWSYETSPFTTAAKESLHPSLKIWARHLPFKNIVILLWKELYTDCGHERPIFSISGHLSALPLSSFTLDPEAFYRV